MTDISREALRIIDANTNRIGEGLRVLEEFSRLALDDEEITQALKTARHQAVNLPREVQEAMLEARDSDGDVGRDMDVPGESGQRGLAGTVTANAKRVQESLRVMEEIAKTTAGKLDPEVYRRTRFSLYTLEKDLITGLKRIEGQHGRA